MKLIELTEKTFKQKIINISKKDLDWSKDFKLKRPVVILFVTDWSLQSKAIAPEIIKLANKYKSKINTYYINGETYPAIAEHFEITKYPSVLFASKNVPAKIGEGYSNVELMEKILNELFDIKIKKSNKPKPSSKVNKPLSVETKPIITSNEPFDGLHLNFENFNKEIFDITKNEKKYAKNIPALIMFIDSNKESKFMIPTIKLLKDKYLKVVNIFLVNTEVEKTITDLFKISKTELPLMLFLNTDGDIKSLSGLQEMELIEQLFNGYFHIN